MTARAQRRMYKKMIRPAVLYGLEMMAILKGRKKMVVAEMKVLWLSTWKVRLYRARNEVVREEMKVTYLGGKLREARLRLLGHVIRRKSMWDRGRGWRLERERGRPNEAVERLHHR